MSSRMKVALPSGALVLLVLAAGLFAGRSLLSSTSSRAHATPPLTYHATANGPYHVSGNTIIGADGLPYIFHGIGRDGLEYKCSGDSYLDQQHLAYMGTRASGAGSSYWFANTVRLPVSEGFWLYGNGSSCTAASYQMRVDQTVDILTSLKLNVILDLQWVDAAGQSHMGGGPWAMPDADSITFWQQAAQRFASYSNVLFELYNEPHPPSWQCWSAGCLLTDTVASDDCKCQRTLTYQSVGMQALVNAVRGVQARNPLIVGGVNWGFDLSQIPTYHLTGTNIIYDTHPYNYADKAPSTWDAAFGNVSARYPVISAESGEYDCGTSFMGQLLPYLDAHGIGWLAWAWTVLPGRECTYPLLITDYQGTPAPSMGQYIYVHLHGYAPAQGPVSKSWYFAEGRVGAGFKEFLTLSNPDAVNDCPVTIQYLPEGGSPTSKGVLVPHATRLTESVNGDLNIPDTRGPGVSVSAIVTVSATSCRGIAAERPMYFSWHGLKSGSDVVGATHLGQSFFFGDIPTGNGYTSFLTVLNPPANKPASVTATYYAGGRAVGTQNVTIQPGHRGTIAPTNTGLPAHVAAVLTSNQPVMAERPDYFVNVGAGNAGTVSGASSVVGAQSLSNDWLFSEGYTGSGFQEYLVIANVDAVAHAMASVTIKLEYASGAVQTYTVAVGSLDQVIWNVNQSAPAGSNVSAEVTSTGANIVVEREMFFRYRHTIGVRNGFQVNAIGGTDVLGQIGPASAAAYTFAEGYSNRGYNEWLTLQNPTGSDEAISLTLVNGYGRAYVPAPIVVRAHSRYTIDVSALVLQYLVGRGDDHRGYEVSMTMQASGQGAYFVAERPMYWNTGAGGTQGGSDVLGYTGL